MRLCILSLLFFSSFLFNGCAIVPGVEATNLSQMQSATTKMDFQTVLGEPLETYQTKAGRVDVYIYDQGAEASGFIASNDLELVLLPILWVATPFTYMDKKDDQEAYLYALHDTEKNDQLVGYFIPRAVSIDEEPDTEVIDWLGQSDDPEILWELVQASKSGHAWSWKCRAANKGHVEAQLMMAKDYRYGFGAVNVDRAQAYKWYALTAQNGEPEGATGRDQTVEYMTSEEMIEAKRALAEWQPNVANCEVKAALPGS